MENIKQKRLLIICIVVLAILNIAALSTFWMSPKHRPDSPHKGGHHHAKHDKGLKILTKQLELSDEQQDVFKNLRKEHFELMDSIQLDLKNTKDKFFEEMTNEVIVDSVIINRIDETTITYGYMDKALFKHYKELRNECNDKQKEILRSIFAEMLKRENPRGRR